MTARSSGEGRPTAPPSRTIEQRRAEDALRAVRIIDAGLPSQSADDVTKLRKTYRSYVERVGPAILMNGLGQALATEWAAGGREPKTPEQHAHHRLYRHIEVWLCGDSGIFEGVRPTVQAYLLDAIVTRSEGDYLRAQAEALAWIVWHKKFCRAILPREEPSSTKTDEGST